MIKTVTAGQKGAIDFKAEKPYHLRPTITETFFDGAIKMYRSGTRVFIASLFDAFFSPATAIRMKGRKWKGQNPDRTKAFLQDEFSY